MKTKMVALLGKNSKEPQEPEFIVLNEYAQVFSGLKRGYPAFSDNWDDARTLTNINQFKKVQYGTIGKLEIHYV
jgi:hypothetical protein